MKEKSIIGLIILAVIASILLLIYLNLDSLIMTAQPMQVKSLNSSMMRFVVPAEQPYDRFGIPRMDVAYSSIAKHGSGKNYCKEHYKSSYRKSDRDDDSHDNNIHDRKDSNHKKDVDYRNENSEKNSRVNKNYNKWDD